jgi:hypothetical protein
MTVLLRETLAVTVHRVFVVVHLLCVGFRAERQDSH